MSGVTLYRLADLPRETILSGGLSRTALRGDDSLVTFNWFEPHCARPEPHSHPFDQLSLVFSGRLRFEIDGQVIDMDAGTALRVPAGVPHTASPIGDEVVLNVDIFAPVRADYVFLTAHQTDIDQED